jgi:hypothetical protein
MEVPCTLVRRNIPCLHSMLYDLSASCAILKVLLVVLGVSNIRTVDIYTVVFPHDTISQKRVVVT